MIFGFSLALLDSGLQKERGQERALLAQHTSESGGLDIIEVVGESLSMSMGVALEVLLLNTVSGSGTVVSNIVLGGVEGQNFSKVTVHSGE